jgi:hypothetical protein
VDKIWCEYEGESFSETDFALYEGGPLRVHLNVKRRHTTNGIEIGGPGPEPYGIRAPDRVSYGLGPMARPPDEPR